MDLMNFHHVTPTWNLENLKANTTDSGRFYTTSEGLSFPSVTTVVGWKKTQFFAEWRRKNPVESKTI